MSDTEVDEAWENTGAGQVWLTLPDGREKVTKTVYGGKTFYVSAADRRRFSTDVADPDADPFRNGTFRYQGDIQLFGTERERAELASSPNALTPDQMLELAQAPPADFSARLAEMTNPVAVHALKAAAESISAPQARTDAIDARLAALRPITPEAGDPDLGDIEGSREEPPQQRVRSQQRRSSADVG